MKVDTCAREEKRQEQRHCFPALNTLVLLCSGFWFKGHPSVDKSYNCDRRTSPLLDVVDKIATSNCQCWRTRALRVLCMPCRESSSNHVRRAAIAQCCFSPHPSLETSFYLIRFTHAWQQNLMKCIWHCLHYDHSLNPFLLICDPRGLIISQLMIIRRWRFQYPWRSGKIKSIFDHWIGHEWSSTF